MLPFAQPQEEKPLSESIACDHSLIEIDRELDILFDTMQDELEEAGEASQESIERFHVFCDAYGEKVDRIVGSFASWKPVQPKPRDDQDGRQNNSRFAARRTRRNPCASAIPH